MTIFIPFIPANECFIFSNRHRRVENLSNQSIIQYTGNKTRVGLSTTDEIAVA